MTSSIAWRSDQDQRRIDPADGLAYTWEEFSAYYARSYKKKVIEAYWNDCNAVGPWEKDPVTRSGQPLAYLQDEQAAACVNFESTGVTCFDIYLEGYGQTLC